MNRLTKRCHQFLIKIKKKEMGAKSFVEYMDEARRIIDSYEASLLLRSSFSSIANREMTGTNLSNRLRTKDCR